MSDFSENDTKDTEEYPPLSEEIEEEDCQCRNHEEHKKLLNPENYDDQGNELDDTPEGWEGSRAEYQDYLDSID